MDLSKTKKIVYEVRYSIGGGLTMRLDVYDTKAEAIRIATNESKQDKDRLYFVKRIATEIVFSIGKCLIYTR